jgi:hypothetical protein
VAASYHGDTQYSGNLFTSSAPVTPYTTSVDVNSNVGLEQRQDGTETELGHGGSGHVVIGMTA